LNGSPSTAIGLNTTASGSGSIAIGLSTTASGIGSIAIGLSTTVIGDNNVAIGAGAQALGDPTTAIGYRSFANGNDAVALGANSIATGNNSVALGANSVADEANTVSVGTQGSERRITNLANGLANSDAANMGQVREVARIAYSGVAMSLALSGAVSPTLQPGEMGVGVGLGTYQGYSAVAVQLRALSATGKAAYTIGISGTNSQFGAHIGFGFKW
jgi:autotransporter adhesin